MRTQYRPPAKTREKGRQERFEVSPEVGVMGDGDRQARRERTPAAVLEDLPGQAEPLTSPTGRRGRRVGVSTAVDLAARAHA